jgi:hypothetical protein
MRALPALGNLAIVFHNPIAIEAVKTALKQARHHDTTSSRKWRGWLRGRVVDDKILPFLGEGGDELRLGTKVLGSQLQLRKTALIGPSPAQLPGLQAERKT